MELTVEIINQLCELVVKHKLDHLKVDGLHIIKSKYDVVKAEQATQLNKQPSIMDEDELLYWSTSTPTLTAEQIEELAANPPPKPAKRKVKDR